MHAEALERRRGCPPSASSTPAAASSVGRLRRRRPGCARRARRRTRPGSRPRAAPRRARARQDRLAEPLHLAAAVVEVVLALDRVAGELEDPRERVAEGGVAAGGRGQRPGRVGGDELDLDALALRRPAPNASPGRRARRRPPRRYQASARNRLRKPGPATSTFSTLRAEPLLQRGAEPLGDRARRLAQRGREQHRGVGGVVAEAGLLAAARGSGGRRRRRRCASSAAAACTAVLRSSSGVAMCRVNDGTARRRGSCARGRAARAASRARAGAGTSSGRTTAARRSARARSPNGAADDEADVAPGLAALLQPARERRRSRTCVPRASSSTRCARGGMRRSTLLVVAHLDQLDARVPGRAACA